jgi:hypothetical protein
VLWLLKTRGLRMKDDNNNTIVTEIGPFFQILGQAIVGGCREHPVIAFIAVTMISFLVFIHY